MVDVDTLLPGQVPEALERAGRERLASFLAESRLGGRALEGRVRVGDPAREIARVPEPVVAAG